MADSLFGALVDEFNSNASLSGALSGGLWMGQIPEGIDVGTTAFCVLLTTGQTIEWSSGSPYTEESLIQFVIFKVGLAAAEAAADFLKATFDFATLAFTGSGVSSVALYRTGYQAQAEEFRDPDGNLVYSVTVEYRVIVQRART